MNDEYTQKCTHSTQSPLERPKYIKKICTKSKQKTTEHLVNKYNK
jgi:hypothetical protein